MDYDALAEPLRPLVRASISRDPDERPTPLELLRQLDADYVPRRTEMLIDLSTDGAPDLLEVDVVVETPADPTIRPTVQLRKRDSTRRFNRRDSPFLGFRTKCNPLPNAPATPRTRHAFVAGG